MASTPAGPTLICSQCSFVNEAERVYCHNCGAKLDRTLLPKSEENKKESVERTRKRVQRMTNPGGPTLVSIVKTLASLLLTAAMVAAIIQIVREPAGVPPAKSQELVARMVSSDLSEALDSPEPRVLQFTEAEVNNHLRTTLKTKAPGVLPGAQFERAFVRFVPGNVCIGLQQSVAGFPLYSGARYEIGIKSGNFFATNHGGNLGRLAIHPALMKYAGTAFKPLWTALKREHDAMPQMRQIAVGDQRIGLVTKGKAP